MPILWWALCPNADQKILLQGMHIAWVKERVGETVSRQTLPAENQLLKLTGHN
jgi:hypothetical protein